MLGFKKFLLDEEGVGVVEMILIVVVLIGLVVLFKSKLTTLVTNIFSTITDQAGKV
jgi:Flp pilus assembly pilin Flp